MTRNADVRTGHAVEGGTVTFLFTDLVGSTRLIESLGDDRSDPLIRAHLSWLRAVVSLHKGHVVKSLGDGLMAAFSSAANAIDAAVHMQQVVTASRGEDVPELQLRIGINAGEAVFDGIDYYGKPVWIAQRFCDAAAGGQILVSDVVRELIGSRGSHVFVERGMIALRGVSQPVTATEVAWEPDPEIDLSSLEAAPTGSRRSRAIWVGLALVIMGALSLAAIVFVDRDTRGSGDEVVPRGARRDGGRGLRPLGIHAVSVHLGGAPGSADASHPSVADGGDLVAFSTTAQLTRSDRNQMPDVYLSRGSDSLPVLVSSGPGGSPGNGPSTSPRISADGSRVVFLSRATDLVPGVTDGLQHVYLFEVGEGSLRVVSRRSNGDLAVDDSVDPSISATGEAVGFASKARNLAVAGDANGQRDVFRHYVGEGLTNRVSVPSVNSAEVEPNGPSSETALSPSGAEVGFTSKADNLVEGDGRMQDVFFYSRERIPVKVSRADAAEANGPSYSPSLAEGARAVAFVSEATDLAANDTNATSDVFVWTIEGIEQISVSPSGSPGDAASYAPMISADGRFVAFLSDASNLVEGDTNGATDAFVRDLERDTTTRVSLTIEGGQLDGATSAVSLSRGGKHYAFVAPARSVDPISYPSTRVGTVFAGVLRPGGNG